MLMDTENREEVIMKKTKFLTYAGVLLAVVCSLVFTACPQEPDPEPPTKLKGTWSNNKEGGLERKFTINADFTFEADINPSCIGAGSAAIPDGLTADQTWWKVAGKLNLIDEDSGTYTMTNLEEKNGVYNNPVTNDVLANAAVRMINNHKVKITFDGDDKFVFASAENSVTAAQVNLYFGDTYLRQQ
jgi:hypothetical protein